MIKDVSLCIDAYNESSLDGACHPMAPDGRLEIELDDGTTYAPPRDETTEKFLDRIERSEQAGRNLFREEWQQFKHVYDPDIVI